MARVIALMALAALGLTEAPVHEPVHDHHSEHLMSTTESYHAPRNIRRSARRARPLVSRPMRRPKDWYARPGHVLPLLAAQDSVAFRKSWLAGAVIRSAAQ